MSALTQREIDIAQRWHATLERQKRLPAPPAHIFTGQARAIAKNRLPPRVPPRERLCLWVQETVQATRITLRQMNPTPAEWLQVACVHVFGFACTALHTFWPVSVLAVACWLYAWSPVLIRQAHHWRDRASRARRKRVRRAKRPQAPPVHATSWQAQRALCERYVSAAEQGLQDLERYERQLLFACSVIFAALSAATLAIGS